MTEAQSKVTATAKTLDPPLGRAAEGARSLSWVTILENAFDYVWGLCGHHVLPNSATYQLTG